MTDIKPINCKNCGTPLEEHPEEREYQRKCPKCQEVWLVKPCIIWEYWQKYKKVEETK